MVIGTRLAHYEVIEKLGEGGMGEVYRARDTKLARDVALKILPDAFLSDAERIARFQREAQVLASLNHPNIAAIHGLEDSPSTGGTAGVRALVLELVEGPTLADRLQRGAIEFDEAIAIARQIAQALAAAHDLGIVHRDLKPANVKLRPDGTVKVLDFGLAKATSGGEHASRSAAHPATITSPAMTHAGVILGTAAYMSPEQAKGATVDKRTDVWAFGCVLYEMLTGRLPFEGASVTETLAGILKSDVDWAPLPAATPEATRRLLRWCLQKDTKLRLRDMGDAVLELDVVHAAAPTPSISSRVSSRERFAWAAAVTLAAVGGLTAIWFLSRPGIPPPEARLEIATPPSTQPESFAISPDGEKIVYAAIVNGRSALWMRELSALAPRKLEGTEDGYRPFWSSDSRMVAFFAPAGLKRIDTNGGAAQLLTTALNGYGGAWSRDGIIVFVPSAAPQALVQIPASGGQLQIVGSTTPAPQQYSQRSPQFLPDGRHFIYKVEGPPEVRGIYVGELGDTPARRLVDADEAVYQSGRLLFARQGTAFSQPFDAGRLTLTGTSQPFADQVRAISASETGPVVLRIGLPDPALRLKWFDRSGRDLGAVEGGDGGDGPSISPDGRRIAVYRSAGGNVDVWIIEPRGVRTRFTVDPAVDNFPLWSPDGTRVAFSSTRLGGAHNLFWKPAVGGAEELLLKTDEVKTCTDWSRDGRFLLFRSSNMANSHDVWALRLDDRQPIPVARTRFSEREGTFSPDGRWVAYQSDESGQYEIYVQAFPGEGPKWQVSPAGGSQPRWTADGKGLFFVAADSRLMRAGLTLAPHQQSVETGAITRVIDTQVGGALSFLRHQYAVSTDEQRILVSTVNESFAAPLVVILNWNPAS